MKKSKLFLVSLLLGLAGLAGASHCQAQTTLVQNTVVTYQGMVQDNGTNFTGTGQFQFALVTSTNATATATATADAPSNGYITGYSIISGGSGYVTAPAVTVSGGGGTGAAATATISGGVVTHLSVANVGNGNYTSTPMVTIAPPPPNITYDTYWSNDGTSAAGSEPAAAVSLPVTNGLFTVVLGSPALPNMAVIPATLFSEPNLQLRIWFNDGTHGFAALSPVQNLTPSPYATFAANAGSAATATIAGSASSVAAVNITGTLPAAQLPANVLTNGATGVTITGTFSGNGAGVTNVSFGTLIGNWGNFLLASSPSPGGDFWSVAAADVNGDSHVDLITVNAYGSTLLVFTNNGSGGFGPPATYNVGSYPIAVTATNVTGSGHVDLICANFNDDTLSVLTNNGSGVFATSGTYAVGNSPISVTAADVNGDGHLDLICANYYGNTLSILTNNGSGRFVSAGTATVGSYPNCVTAADVNGDGHVDLICANSGGASLTVLTNNGSGIFITSGTYLVGSGPASVTAADVNSDGHVDLICANLIGNTLTVLTNNGSGGFVTAGTYPVGSDPNSVTAADVNGDGHVDLISANDGGNSLSVLTNNGSGGFVTAGTYPIGSYPQSVTAADVSGDGHVDLITANNSGSLSIFFNVPGYYGDFTGSGSGLAGVPAGTLTGTLPAGVFPTNVVLSGGLSLDAANINPGTIASNALTFGNNLQNATSGIASKRVGANNVYDLEFYTGGVDRLTILNAGNVGIGTTNPAQLFVVGLGASPAYCNGTTWVNGSDRNSKTDFAAIDPQAVLAKISALPITEWQYKVDPRGEKHIGPMAQDFYAAFGLNGTDDKHISTVDEGGVALAAIQALNQKLEAQNATLQRQNEILATRLQQLAAAVQALTPGK